MSLKRWSYFLIIFIMFILSASNASMAPKNSILKSKDLNYRYTVAYAGIVADFYEDALKGQTEIVAASKIFCELSIESIYGGVDWLPLNPFITDNANHIYHDYKVVVAPMIVNSTISIKYYINPIGQNDIKTISLFEEGISNDGKKSYRMILKNIPIDIK